MTDPAKTALLRHSLSEPIERALEDKVLRPGLSFLDYGCGRGTDLAFLAKMGYRGVGYDPHWRPKLQRCLVDVVNMGYVLNVIEQMAERVVALKRAWACTKQVLIVTVRTDARKLYGELKLDGKVSQRGTFQKFYTNDEIVAFLTEHLQTTPHRTPVPGMAYCFKSPEAEQFYLQERSKP